MYEFLLKRKIKRMLNRSDREKVYHNLKEIKTVLVLFDTENFADAEYFIQQMKKLGKRVRALAYKDKQDVRDYSKILFNILTPKDLKDFKRESLTQILNSFETFSFDLIADLSLKENLLLQYALVSIKAPMKVGFYKAQLPIHDIIIYPHEELENDGNTSLKELGKQLIFYLTTISSEKKII
ncbi:MAG: hypothetical protein LBU22_04685 [Dysgonamonadaceae bacterium]|jgi:hypothetical protein|nr:hypothetical protein [Dysgonamonadaceae bacterium]